MPPSPHRVVRALARLRYFLPALALTALAAPIEHPATLALLLLAQPLFAAGAVSLLGYLLETDFATLALRRGTVLLALVTGYAALVALVLGTPVVQLVQQATPLAAVLVSGGFALALLALWRLWPAFGLALLWDDAYPEAERGSWILAALRRCAAFARHLTAERDPYFGCGLPVAMGVLAVFAGAMSRAGLCGTLPSELRIGALWLWGLVLCPLVHLGLAWRVERLLLDESGAEAEADAATTDAAETPVLPPLPEPAQRDAQLLAAAAQNQIDLALALLEAGAGPDLLPAPQDRDQRSLAMLAATSPDLRLLRALIARGVDLNRAVGGLTPLLAATRDSYQGRPEAVMTLLTNGADPRRADPAGNTALHHAALSCEAAVAAMLVDAGADPNAVNRDGLTPLGVACGAGNEVLARFLLEHGARPDAPRAQSALIAAASGADDLPRLLKLLLKHRADVGARDRLGRSALHAAALHGHAEAADALLAAGAPVDAVDANGVTALMEAARAGSNRVLQRLVFRKPEPNRVDAAGRSALHLACLSRHANEETVRLLLALGADPALAAADGRRALDHAVAAGRWTLVALLDSEYPLPQALGPDADEPTAESGPDRLAVLHGALRHGRLPLAAELLALAPLTAPERVEAYLAATASPAACDLLLEHGVAADDRDAAGDDLLHRLVRLHPLPRAAIERLLGHGAAVGGGTLLLELPADDDDAESLGLALLERGADPFRADARGRRPLQLAAAHAQPRLLEALLARGSDPNAADARGRTALHELAALPEIRALPLARLLLRHGADPARAAGDGQTPLGAALAAGRQELARWLSWTGPWRHPARPLRGDDLPAAAAAGDRAAIERLLDLGLPIDAQDAQGCTALLRAAGNGQLDAVDLLLRRGADPARAALTGATPLSAAVSARRDAVVLRLIGHGVSPDQRLPGGSTPLMVAAALGHVGIVELLLERGADPAAADEQQQDALHAACQHAFGSADGERARRLIRRLIAAGCPPDRPNAQGQTPLLLLLGARVAAGTPSAQRQLTELLELLIAHGADVGVQDQRGVGPLHAAAMHGLMEPTLMLLRAGADPQARDRLGRTAHEVATMLGYADVAGELRRLLPMGSRGRDPGVGLRG